MGHEAKARSEVRHFRKLFGGRATAQEIHAQLGFGKPCHVCGGPPSVRVRVFAPYYDLFEKQPETMIRLAAITAATTGAPAHVPTVDTRWGPMVKISDLCACRHHRADLEKAAAHPPGGLDVWVWVDAGPGADRPTIQVPRGFAPPTAPVALPVVLVKGGSGGDEPA